MQRCAALRVLFLARCGTSNQFQLTYWVGGRWSSPLPGPCFPNVKQAINFNLLLFFDLFEGQISQKKGPAGGMMAARWSSVLRILSLSVEPPVGSLPGAGQVINFN